MQVALGRLQFTVVVAPRVERRQAPAPSVVEAPLERTYRREQRLQQIENERTGWPWFGILAAPKAGPRERRHSAPATLADDPWWALRRVR